MLWKKPQSWVPASGLGPGCSSSWSKSPTGIAGYTSRRVLAAPMSLEIPLPGSPSPPPNPGSQALLPSLAAHSHRATLKVVVEGFVQQVLLAAAGGAHEAEVDVVISASKPLAAGSHRNCVGGHGGGRAPRAMGSRSSCSLCTLVWGVHSSPGPKRCFHPLLCLGPAPAPPRPAPTPHQALTPSPVLLQP